MDCLWGSVGLSVVVQIVEGASTLTLMNRARQSVIASLVMAVCLPFVVMFTTIGAALSSVHPSLPLAVGGAVSVAFLVLAAVSPRVARRNALSFDARGGGVIRRASGETLLFSAVERVRTRNGPASNVVMLELVLKSGRAMTVAAFTKAEGHHIADVVNAIDRVMPAPPYVNEVR